MCEDGVSSREVGVSCNLLHKVNKGVQVLIKEGQGVTIYEEGAPR